MTVNRPIATEQQDQIDLIARRRHPHAPFDALVSLKRFEAFRRTSQPEDRRSAHWTCRE
jgi:hypothetical protein